MTTFGSTTEDEHGLPKSDEKVQEILDRGPPGEDWKTPAELRGDMNRVAQAKLSMGEIATVRGIEERMIVVESMIDDMSEQYNAMVGLVMTLQGELDQFKQQWNIERQSWLANGGSTTPEDVSGNND